MKTQNNLKWIASSDVRTTYSQDGAILLDVKKKLSYSLNLTAARIWAAIENSPNGITAEGIVDVLEMHFRVPRRQLETDTSDWLDKLQQLKLVSNPLGHTANSS